LATNFPANPSNGDTHAGFTFNSATGAWESSAVTPPAQDPAVTVYATVDDLPTSGVTTGQQAFVSATNRLYIWNSSGWYNIALINTNPTISGASATYNLNTDGSNNVVVSNETRKLHSKIQKNIMKNMSQKERSKKYGSHGKSNPFYGKKHPKELQEEINKKISKKYILTHPNGTKENIINLYRYCKENGLNRDSLMKVMNTLMFMQLSLEQEPV